MDRRPSRAAVTAERHRLSGGAGRLAIMEALEEGPCQVPELARMLGVHPATVRTQLEGLVEAGVLEEERGATSGRGRPGKRYRLRQPLLAGDPEVRLFVGSIASLLGEAYGERAATRAEQEGVRRGRQLAPSFGQPSQEQAVREVLKALTRLSFAPAAPVRRDEALAIDVHHCPFEVDPRDRGGAIVCAFHQGLLRGLAEASSGQDVGVRLAPLVSPDVCRIELSFRPARPAESDPAGRRRPGGTGATPAACPPAAPTGRGRIPAGSTWSTGFT